MAWTDDGKYIIKEVHPKPNTERNRTPQHNPKILSLNITLFTCFGYLHVYWLGVYE